VLKTIPKHEFHFMRRILKNYYNYHTSENTESLMSKIFGLHKVIFYRKKGKKSKKIYFCIMSNVFNTSKKIDYRYDLKGSTQGRLTTFNKNEEHDPTIALKDLNFINAKEKFCLERGNQEKLFAILSKDTKFFADNGIIDYSLLVGVHTIDPMLHESDNEINMRDYVYSMSNKAPNKLNKNSFNALQPPMLQIQSSVSLMNEVGFNKQCESGLPSLSFDKIYFIGIIDILTEYSTKKQMEHLLRSI
jgi:1-phosphatidylinositol-4-phosphate 5-kinase